jgi:hypothetical protein
VEEEQEQGGEEEEEEEEELFDYQFPELDSPTRLKSRFFVMPFLE